MRVIVQATFLTSREFLTFYGGASSPCGDPEMVTGPEVSQRVIVRAVRAVCRPCKATRAPAAMITRGPILSRWRRRR